jgi:hypothetical protein
MCSVHVWVFEVCVCVCGVCICVGSVVWVTNVYQQDRLALTDRFFTVSVYVWVVEVCVYMCMCV